MPVLAKFVELLNTIKATVCHILIIFKDLIYLTKAFHNFSSLLRKCFNRHIFRE